MCKRGVSYPVACSFVRETRGAITTVRASPTVASQPWVRLKSTMQGDAAASKRWNVALDEPLQEFIDICKARGLGMRFDWASSCC